MRFFAETKRTTHNTLIRHVSSSGFVFPAITCAISSRCGGRRDAPRATVRLQEYESPRVLQPALQKAADAYGEKDEVHFGQVNGYKEKAIQTRYEVKGHPSFKVTLLADSLSLSLLVPLLVSGCPPPSARICSVVRQRQHGCVALLLRPLHGWIRRYAHQNGELALLSHACPPAGAAVHSRAFFRCTSSKPARRSTSESTRTTTSSSEGNLRLDTPMGKRPGGMFTPGTLCCAPGPGCTASDAHPACSIAVNAQGRRPTRPHPQPAARTQRGTARASRCGLSRTLRVQYRYTPYAVATQNMLSCSVCAGGRDERARVS